MKNVQIFFFIFVFGLIQCKEPFESNLETEARYVVSCFIGPGDPIACRLGRSTPLGAPFNLRQDSQLVARCQVRIIKYGTGADTVVLSHQEEGLFISEDETFVISPNQGYRLEITTPENKRITGECLIPAPCPATRVLLERTPNDYFMRFVWTDPRDTVNYYRLYAMRPSFQVNGFTFPDFIVQWGAVTDIPSALMTDAGTDGGTIQSRPGDLINSYTSSGQLLSVRGISKGDRVLAGLYHIDRHYYLFQQSFEAQQRGAFAEPTQLYTNLNDALGCFGGYTKVEGWFDL